MCNTADVKRTSYWLASFLACFAFVSIARAAPPRHEGGLEEGHYIQFSPGPVAVVVGEHNFSDRLHVAWPWSLGGGRMYTHGPHFKATIGGIFEHHAFFDGDLTLHGINLLVETRVGAGSRRVWGYGLLGIGPTVTGTYWKSPKNSASALGITSQFGGGVQGMVGRRFFLGAEADLDLGHYFYMVPPTANLFAFSRFFYATIAFEFSLGWYF